MKETCTFCDSDAASVFVVEGFATFPCCEHEECQATLRAFTQIITEETNNES